MELSNFRSAFSLTLFSETSFLWTPAISRVSSNSVPGEAVFVASCRAYISVNLSLLELRVALSQYLMLINEGARPFILAKSSTLHWLAMEARSEVDDSSTLAHVLTRPQCREWPVSRGWQCTRYRFCSKTGRLCRELESVQQVSVAQESIRRGQQHRQTRPSCLLLSAFWAVCPSFQELQTWGRCP
jgi:hypothetical protein